DHARIESDAGHDCEMLTVDPPQVQTPALAMESNVDRPGQVARDADVAREQVRRASRNDGNRRARTHQGVRTTLHHAVPTPDEDQVATPSQRLTYLAGSLPALRNLVPQHVAALGRDQPAELAQSPAQRLSPVGYDRDPAARTRLDGI